MLPPVLELQIDCDDAVWAASARCAGQLRVQVLRVVLLQHVQPLVDAAHACFRRGIAALWHVYTDVYCDQTCTT